MQIRQTRVVVRAKSFERTCNFYGGSLALPRLSDWERETERGALFQAGGAVIEVIGRPGEVDPRSFDEAYDYQGPRQKMVVVFTVPSADQAYKDILKRDPGIPGGLHNDADGRLVFETHDPDGVHVLCTQAD